MAVSSASRAISAIAERLVYLFTALKRSRDALMFICLRDMNELS